MLRLVDDTWNATNATNAFMTPRGTSYWTAEAIRRPGWSLADLVAEAA